MWCARQNQIFCPSDAHNERAWVMLAQRNQCFHQRERFRLVRNKLINKQLLRATHSLASSPPPWQNQFDFAVCDMPNGGGGEGVAFARRLVMCRQKGKRDDRERERECVLNQFNRIISRVLDNRPAIAQIRAARPVYKHHKRERQSPINNRVMNNNTRLRSFVTATPRVYGAR